MHDCILELINIEKEYSGNKVLKGVNFSVHAGEIHALVGENGAGKSTLMNILFGMPVIQSTGGYSGSIVFNGEKVEINSPTDSIKLGIGMVHQEFMLLPGFTVTENIKLNCEKTKPNLFSRLFGKRLETLDYEAMREDAVNALEKLDMKSLQVDEMISRLPVGYKQFVEIAREIDKENIKLLIFDEPTAVLTEEESQIFLKTLKHLAAQNVGIIFISHKLDEVIKVADTVTILKDGEQVASLKTCDTNVVELAELMVGRKSLLDDIIVRDPVKREENKKIALSIRNLSVNMPGEQVKGVDLDIYEGEILGIGGLSGQGKIGIPNGVMGLYEADGEVSLFGKPLSLNKPKESLQRGLGFVSEDRRGVGLLLDQSIEFNIALSAMQVNGDFLKNFGFMTQIDSKKIRKYALEEIERFDIRCKGPEQLCGSLSGGNQQKVCISRALALRPKLLFVTEPTRGIDIGAKRKILETLARLNKEEGLTIVIVSSEFAELKSISDRIAVVFNGKVEGIFSHGDPDADFGLMLSGEYKNYYQKGGECNEESIN